MTIAKPVRIAVLDSVPRAFWADDHGYTDAQKFVDLLAPENDQARFDIFCVSENQFPASLDLYHGIVLTGSPCSVHDDLDWIVRLGALVREADAQNRRIVASCFGHQLVAKTYGGEVGKSDIGWMIGNYPLSIDHHYSWMPAVVQSTTIYHFNQERVTRLPEGAKAFARSEVYPDFAYTLGDNILSVQGHPEQPKQSMHNFLNAMESDLPAPVLAGARKQIDTGEPDAKLWAQWMMGFLSQDR